jgi:O-antigen ligase
MAAICGLAYLVNKVFSFPRLRQRLRRGEQFSTFSQWLRRNAPFLAIIVLSLCALAFWQSRQTDGAIARRAVSVGNMNDFSWRNRLSAWEGALQIMAEHPWLGAGWNQPERMYDNYYRPVKSEEAAAIYLNDYFMLGATLGIPALFCFGMYIWLSLKQNSEFDKSEIRGVDWSKTVCRAGAIVLLVGFWFDGGLFNLPTASMFWILLELGVARSTPAKIAVPA